MMPQNADEPEFSRPFDVRQLDHKAVTLVANAQECAALALRFDIVRIDRLEAEIVLERRGQTLNAVGNLEADIVQSCAVSAEDLAVAIREPLSFRFVPATSSHHTDQEIELDTDALDEIEFGGTTADLGEAVAQSLALAIDPFAVGPEAEAARKLLDSGTASPFAALAKLVKKD